MHVYIFAHWTLQLLELKPHFASLKFELLPYLVRARARVRVRVRVTLPRAR